MNSNSFLEYVGGTSGAIALTGIAAASAIYFATRPKPEKPLVPLDQQTVVIKETEGVSEKNIFNKIKNFDCTFSFAFTIVMSTINHEVKNLFKMKNKKLDDDVLSVRGKNHSRVCENEGGGKLCENAWDLK